LEKLAIGPFASFITVPDTSQGQKGKHTTRNQELTMTSKDTTSVQGPTLQGCAAVQVTVKDRLAKRRRAAMDDAQSNTSVLLDYAFSILVV